MATITKLPALVRDRFKAARSAEALTFYETKLSILQCKEVPFQVRFSPALANKPKSNKPRDPKEKPFDPFSNPAEDLFITELSSHILVLNKFPVIPDHFILATKVYKEQTHLLDEQDLEAAYSCLEAYRTNGEELFGFYNSGEHSGASQPHRHIQFLPVESMRSGMTGDQSWSVLADILTQKPDLPFTYYSAAIPAAPSPQKLHEIYTTLYRNACQKIHGSTATAISNDLESAISYNLGLTDRTMALCPRTSEGIKIKGNDGELIGPVSLNGTVLGGTLLVKSEAEWNALRSDDSKLEEVLRSIGIASNNSALNERL